MPCGIGGIVSKDPIDREIATAARNLLERLTRRGTDSYGWYNGHSIYKRPGDFKTSKDRSAFPDIIMDGPTTSKLLLHTRATTNGAPEINKNNHPFRLDNLILAHNGRFYTWDDFENPWGIETDSFAYLYWIWKEYIERNISLPEAINDGLNHVRGQYAIWLHDEKNDHTYLFRNISQAFTLFYWNIRDLLVFASERSMVKNTLKELGYKPRFVNRINPGIIYRIRGTNIDIVKRFSPRTASAYEVKRRFKRGTLEDEENDELFSFLGGG